MYSFKIFIGHLTNPNVFKQFQMDDKTVLQRSQTRTTNIRSLQAPKNRRLRILRRQIREMLEQTS